MTDCLCGEENKGKWVIINGWDLSINGLINKGVIIIIIQINFGDKLIKIIIKIH